MLEVVLSNIDLRVDVLSRRVESKEGVGGGYMPAVLFFLAGASS